MRIRLPSDEPRGPSPNPPIRLTHDGLKLRYKSPLIPY